MSSNKIVTVITAITGDRVIISEQSLNHVINEHFGGFPKDIILEMAERVLKDPSDIYRDGSAKSKEYDFFYRLESGDFVVVVVKIIPEGAFLSSMYPTGKKHRNPHKKFKRVKL